MKSRTASPFWELFEALEPDITKVGSESLPSMASQSRLTRVTVQAGM
jgi:hypothetical protein